MYLIVIALGIILILFSLYKLKNAKKCVNFEYKEEEQSKTINHYNLMYENVINCVLFILAATPLIVYLFIIIDWLIRTRNLTINGIIIIYNVIGVVIYIGLLIIISRLLNKLRPKYIEEEFEKYKRFIGVKTGIVLSLSLILILTLGQIAIFLTAIIITSIILILNRKDEFYCGIFSGIGYVIIVIIALPIIAFGTCTYFVLNPINFH